MKVAVDYGHASVGGLPISLSYGDLPEASIVRSKDDGCLELSFKKSNDVDLHLALSFPRGRTGEKREGGREEKEVKELILSARSLSAVGVELVNEIDKGLDRRAKLMKSVKKLIRAHECQFNEELFHKVQYTLFIPDITYYLLFFILSLFLKVRPKMTEGPVALDI